MLDMQVIAAALYLKDKEPHDYLHIKHDRASDGGEAFDDVRGVRSLRPWPG